MENSDLHVVGIGASAGGLDAIQQLFDFIPNDTGMAFIIIQHLSPDFVSLMPELLGKHTQMPIFTAEDKQTIEPNCIYLNQRNKNLHIKGRELYLLDKGPKHNLNLPIDIFFHTLGEEYKEKSIGVILSGTGSDGSRGIKTIKEGGGVIIVQDPLSAQFDGMPNSAIATNLVDFILEPEKIADVFSKLPINRFLLATDIESSTSNDVLFNAILEEVYKFSGIDFREFKKNTLHRRLEKRMNIKNIEKLYDYLTYLKSNHEEKEALKNDFLIGVTQFFRDEEAFSALKTTIIPAICKSKKPSEVIRIWSAGCSTGEEVYSIAILFDDYIRTHKLNLDFKIFATDVDSNAVNTASTGSYFINSVNEIEKSYLEQYFLKTGDKIQIIKRIREKVVFSTHNLLNDPPFIKMDLISCRNLLIYLENKIQKKVMYNFHFALNKFGYLFLGNSESLGDIAKSFKTIDTKWKIFQNISESKYNPTQLIHDNKATTLSLANPTKAAHHPRIRFKENPEMIFHKFLSKKFSPASLFIDKNFDILFLTGNAGKRISHGEGFFQNNLLKIVSPDVAAVIRNGIRRLEKENKDIVIKDITTKNGENAISFDIKFHKPKNNDELRDIYFIQFSEDVIVKDEELVIKNIPVDEVSKQRLEDLENELKATKTELQNVVEELETSNEELQSSNEELMASNEELQSTNEELQSVNEELYTVNTELQEKNKELIFLNNDINNLFHSTEIATLFLDNHLRIRKFTPQLKTLFNLEDTDLGRPISSFNSNFNSEVQEGISTDSIKILQKLEYIEKEITDIQGNYYLKRISPFITDDKRIDGVVITFIEINDLKKKENELLEKNRVIEKSNDKFKQVFDESPIGKSLTSLDGKLKVNRAFREITGYTEEELNRMNWERITHPDDIEVSKNAMEGMMSSDNSVNFRKRFIHKDGHIVWTDLHSRKANDPISGEDYFLTAITDITKQIEAELALVEAKKIAESANIHKNYFLANMSHEIRTPMNGVVGFADLLKDEKLTFDERKSYLEIISGNANQLLNLIDDIVDVAKIEANQLKITQKECNVSKMLSELELNFNQLKSDKNKLALCFIAQIPDGYKDLTIQTDCSRLRQVLSNLLNNSFKFSEKGDITFGFRVENEKIIFHVKDQGIGIPNNKLDEIFERFKQINYENNAEFGGTGLGLAICKGIVEMLGGNISVKSKLNVGTEFIFDIPFKDVASKKIYQEKTTSKNIEYSSKTILIAEDDEVVRLYFQEVLSSTKATIIFAENGQIAVDTFAKNPGIDLVLMDIRMPVKNGFEAIDEILKINPKAIIIAQTANVMADEKEKCYHIGCKDYLTKPINKVKLFEALEKWIS